jgi:YggT family protein
MVNFAREIVSFIFGLMELILVVRFGLKLFAASAQAPFVAWIYDVSAGLLRPFWFAFPSPRVSGGSEIEFTTLFAIFAYAILGYIIQEILGILISPRRDSLGSR